MGFSEVIAKYEDDVEFNYEAFKNYRHIKKKFFDLYQFIYSLSQDALLEEGLIEVLTEDQLRNGEFEKELSELLSDYFRSLQDAVSEEEYKNITNKYESETYDLYMEYYYERHN
jgi:hypothetical protein